MIYRYNHSDKVLREQPGYNSSLLQGTFGAKLRDGIYKLHRDHKLSIAVIEQRLKNIDIPEKYWGEMLALSSYNQYNRITDRVEQLLERYVISRIIEALIKEKIINHE